MRLLLAIAIAAFPLVTFGQIPFSLQDRAFLEKTSPLLRELVGYWALEELSGLRYDRTKNGNHLTGENSIGRTSAKVGYGIDCIAASSQCVSHADSPALSVSDIDFTITAWVRFVSAKPGTPAGIVSQWRFTGADQRAYRIAYVAASDRIEFRVSQDGLNSTAVSADNLGSPALNTWYFIVAWHDATANTINIQVNNGTANSAAHSTGAFDATSTFLIGSFNEMAATTFFNGTIDEVGFWKRTLTAAEKTQLYNSGSGVTFPRFQPVTLSSSTLLPSEAYSWWTYPLASVVRALPILNVVDGTGAQKVIQTTALGVRSSSVTLGAGAGQDDHVEAAVAELGDGNVLYAWAHHKIETKLYYYVSNQASGMPPASPSTSFLTTSANASYSQIFTNSNDVYLFSRLGDNTWSCFKSTNNAATWGSELAFMGDANPVLMYCLGRKSGSDLQFLVSNNPIVETNKIWILTADLTTGLVSSGATDLGYLDGSSAGGNTLPAARSELVAIISASAGNSLRLLDIKGDGTAFIWSSYGTNAPTSTYKLSRLTGSDPHTPGDWTTGDIVNAGMFFSFNDKYLGGAAFANESHSGLRVYLARGTPDGVWLIERWDSAAGDGSDWITTTIAASTDFLLRPISPLFATSSFPVYWQICNRYTSYTDYSTKISVQ